MKRDVIVYLDDIMRCIKDIQDFTRKKTKIQFFKNRMVQAAVERKIEIMGEAAKHVPVPFRSRYVSVPWKRICGMRDILIHAYFDVRSDLLWNVVKKEIPTLKKQIQQILEENK